MRDFLAILVLLILIVIAAKIFLWALKSIIVLAVIAAIIYALIRFGVINLRRRG
jgi:hypothetical protein